jgi:hypothetical protein
MNGSTKFWAVLVDKSEKPERFAHLFFPIEYHINTDIREEWDAEGRRWAQRAPKRSWHTDLSSPRRSPFILFPRFENVDFHGDIAPFRASRCKTLYRLCVACVGVQFSFPSCRVALPDLFFSSLFHVFCHIRSFYDILACDIFVVSDLIGSVCGVGIRSFNFGFRVLLHT